MTSRTFLLFIILAILLRLFFAISFYGSVDVDNATHIVKTFHSGKNIYEYTGYNHTPLWLLFLLGADFVSNTFHVPFYFIMKLYAIIADIIITFLLYKISSVKNALVYLFSPVAILISSFHGQFDSIALALLLGAYIFLKQRKYISLALLLTIAIAFKSWPILLLPLFVFHIKASVYRKIHFIGLVLFLSFLPLVPFLFLSPFPTLRNVVLYFGTGDFGLAVFFEYLKNNGSIFSGIVESITSHNFLLARMLFMLVMATVYWFIYTKKLSFFTAAVFLFLSFYSFSLRIGAQYLLWIIPFGLLSNSRIIHVYTVVATLALIASYQGHQSNALRPVSGFEYISIPNFNLPFGLTVSLWWLVCIVWFFYQFVKYQHTGQLGLSSKEKEKQQDHP